MSEFLRQVKEEILGSDFSLSYLDKPVVKQLYEVELIESDKAMIDYKRLEIPSYDNFQPAVRDGMKRVVVAEHMLGGLYHAHLKKLAANILLPRVENAFYKLCELDEKNIFNVPHVADIVKEELGKSDRYYKEALRLMNEWQKLGILVENKCIDVDTAELSSEKKAMVWCGMIEDSRANSLAYIFASIQQGEKWACARDITVYDVSNRGYDVRPFIAAWHDFEHTEAVRRISDFDFASVTKADAPASHAAEFDDNRVPLYM